MTTLTRRRFFALLSGLGAAIAGVVPALTTRTASAQRTDAPVTPLDSRRTDPLEMPPEVYRATGRIYWYDAARGYGFIAPDGGGEEICLHVSALRAAGWRTATEGAWIECQVLRRPNGLQVFRVLQMDETTALPEPRPPRPYLMKDVGDRELAQVTWFNRVRRFGFLTRGEGTPDIFVHLDTVQPAGLAELRPGSLVQVRWGKGPKGAMAAELRPYGSSSFMTLL